MTLFPGLDPVLRVLVLSSIPFVELRVGIPYGIAVGIDPYIATFAGILGTMIEFVVSMSILLVLRLLRSRISLLNRLFTWLDSRADQRSRRWVHYGAAGVVFAVALPIPGTGSWTGLAVAQLLGISLQVSFLLISLGIFLSGVLVGLVASGVIGFLQLG